MKAMFFFAKDEKSRHDSNGHCREMGRHAGQIMIENQLVEKNQAAGSGGPQAAYDQMKVDGEIHADDDQALVVSLFQALYNNLLAYPEVRSSATSIRSWRFSTLFNWKGKDAKPPRGLYLYGGVGRGKSMLMDLFFSAAPVRMKRRVHFHEFMQEVHARLKAWKHMSVKERAVMGGKATGDDPILPIANQLATEATVLCFDEFQVTDIADAMVLGRLFKELIELGVVIVATSNRHPDDLYQGGINRQLFLPVIEMIKSEMHVKPLDGPVDYRLDRMKGLDTWYSPIDETSTEALTEAFFRLTDRDVNDRDKVPTDSVEVMGRDIFVPKAARGVAVFSFKRLCANPLGAADYLAIARRYHTIIMVAVPLLTKDKRNEAKRFTTFIDAIYEQKVKFICSAAGLPHELYPAGDGSFEFERTVSRLMEIQSEAYMKLGHGSQEAVSDTDSS